MGDASFRVYDLSVLCVAAVTRVIDARASRVRWEPLPAIARRALMRLPARLPAELIGPLASELTDLAVGYETLDDLYAHFDDAERQIRLIARGAELVREVWVPGYPVFPADAHAANRAYAQAAG